MHTSSYLHCLILFFSSSAFALPQGSLSTASIPSRLGSLIPLCAEDCVSSVISSTWLACPPDSLSCLCQLNSTNGYTLGEQSVQCLASSCGGPPDSGILGQIYHVCEGQRGALPNTHPTLTATSSFITTSSKASGASASRAAVLLLTTQDTRSTQPSFPTAISEAPLSAGAANAPILTASEPLSTTADSPSTSAPSSSPSPTGTLASATTKSQSASSTMSSQPASPQGSLSRGQIIGIAAAGVASASLSVAAILFCGFLRRRKELKRQSETLRFDPTRSRDDRAGTPVVPAHPAHRTHSQLKRTESPEGASFKFPPKNKERFSLWRKSAVRTENIGIALFPPTRQKDVPYTPMTTTTFRSGPPRMSRPDSKLLPEKPTLHEHVPMVIVDRPWSEYTHIDDGRTESIWSDASCRTSLDWRATQTPVALLPQAARAIEGREPPRAFQSTLPARPELARLPHEFNGQGLRTSRSAGPSSNDPSRPRNYAAFTQRHPHQQGQTPCNSVFRRSAASETEFEEVDDDDESPLVPEDRTAKAARRPTLIHYPPIPRSLSGRKRLVEMSYHDGALRHGTSRAAVPPTAGRR